VKKGALLVALACVLACAAVSFAGSTRIINNIEGLIILEIHLSRASTTDWEEDILGGEVLGPGESVQVTFHSQESECEWDLMAVSEDGEQGIWYDLDLCGVSSITLQPGGTAVLK